MPVMRILVVEDERKIATALSRGLENEGYSVDTAYDGESGYDLAATEDYAAIVLDLMLPKMDGLTVCRKLREESIHTPILMLTAKGEIDDKVVGLNSGADDYLPKPFSFVELVARIKALVRRPRDVVGEKLTVGNLVLDSNTFEVRRGAKKIDLSKREFSLLSHLMRNNGKIQTKEQIIQSIWSYDSDILPNTVEVYVGYLRKKIDRAFPQLPPLIKTARGFGYKIEE